MTEGTGRITEIPAAEVSDPVEEIVVPPEVVDGRAVGDAGPRPRGLPRRSPLAACVLEVCDHIFDDQLLDSIWEKYRGRCYEDVLRFGDFLRERGYHWEHNVDGSPKLDKEYFKGRAHVLGDEVQKIYERWRTVQTLKTFAPPVGDDGFCRTGILPFASQTSRNQPSNAAFAARAAGSPTATMTAKGRRTRSAAKVGSRAYSPSLQRCSILTF